MSAPSSPQLSIVIPVYNEETGVGETIERCLALADELRKCGIHEFEVIAVDDGSKDRTCEVIGRYPQARLISHVVNKGYGAAVHTDAIRTHGVTQYHRTSWNLGV